MPLAATAFAPLKKLLRQFILTIAVLDSDLEIAIAGLRTKKDPQFWRRCYLRCFFSLIEATLWNMKNLAPPVAQAFGVALTELDVNFIREEHTVSDNGKKRQLPKHPKFPANVKGTLHLFARVHQLPQIDPSEFNGQGFPALCRAYQACNRPMHPKKPFDPQVSDADISDALLAVSWLRRQHTLLIPACSAAVQSITH